MSVDITEVLGADGLFAREVPGFVPRAVQQQMAEAVAAAITDYQTLIAEAGTGTGKTYAYLVPALLSGRRVIISTGTKALQDQLFHRDLPRVRSVLGASVSTALLKGRSNYLCLHRLEQLRGDSQLDSAANAGKLQAVQAWSKQTVSGDRAELAELAEDSPLWPRVTSTVDNCLGSDCPFFSECFVVKARRAAQEADVLVVNHHLLFADLAMKQEGFGEVLPGAQAFILDEAHQIPELAGQFFSTSLSSRQIGEMAKDAASEAAAVSGGFGLLQSVLEAVTPALKRLRLAMNVLKPKGPFDLIEGDRAIADALDDLHRVLEELAAALFGQAERSRGLASVYERANTQAARLGQLRDSHARDAVHWYELSAHGFSLHATPLDLAEPLRTLRESSHAAWIYTSATLSVNGQFEHFTRPLGITDARTLALQSPFDYTRQALTYLPAGLPSPLDANYTERMIEAVLPVLAASRGRAFLLFTSHRALERAAQLLQGRVTYPLFVQGNAPRHQLLAGFRESGDGILLGAASFWEGVDVSGEALSCVVIDKLPFSSPDDPVLQARLSALTAAGQNPFTEWQIPTAVIALKQGVGRLIRDIHDRGVLVLCDPRLTGKGYGRLFLASLPAMPRTRELAAVEAFFAEPA